MLRRIPQENIIDIINAELESFKYYLHEKDYYAALLKIQSALSRVKKVPTSSELEKEMRAIVPHILINIICLIKKLSKEEKNNLVENALDVAFVWVNFAHRDLLWEPLMELSLYQGHRLSAAFLDNRHFFTSLPTLKAYHEFFEAFKLSFKRVSHFETEFVPQLKKLNELKEEMKFHDAVVQKQVDHLNQKNQRTNSSAPLKAYSNSIAIYCTQLIALLPSVREARTCHSYPFDQTKELENELSEIQQQHNKKLSMIIKFIESAPQVISAEFISIFRDLQSAALPLANAHQHFEALGKLMNATYEDEIDQINEHIKNYQKILNCYNLALWLMPVSDQRYDAVLNEINKLMAFFIYHISVNSWEQELIAAIQSMTTFELPEEFSLFSLSLQSYLKTNSILHLKDDAFQLNPSFNFDSSLLTNFLPRFNVLGKADAILERISPFLEQLETFGLFNYVIQFYTLVVDTLNKTLDMSTEVNQFLNKPIPANKLLITQTLKRIQSELYAKIKSLTAREVKWHEDRKNLQAPLPPRMLRAWQQARNMLEAQRKHSIDHEEIITTQAGYVTCFKNVVVLIAQEIEKILGPAPDYCLMAFGSFSRRDSAPRSDFEYGILLREKNITTLAYMASWRHLFFLYFTGLGETPHSSAEIFPAGFHIDWGTNTWLTPQLCETPEKMASFFDPHLAKASSQESLYYSLLNPAYVYGDESLLQDYRNKIGQRLRECDVQTQRPMYQQLALERMEQHARDFKQDELPVSDLINIKTRYIQLLTFMVMDIGLYYQIPHAHPIRVMETLANRGLVSQAYKEIFTHIFSELSQVRIQLHLKHRYQFDSIYYSTLPHKIQLLLRDADDLFLRPFVKAQKKMCKKMQCDSLSNLNLDRDYMKELLQTTLWEFLIQAVSVEIKEDRPQRRTVESESATATKHRTVEIEGVTATKRRLREQIRKQLIDPTTGYFSEDKAKQFNLSGKRNVIPIKRYGLIIGYAKPYPDLPGYEKTVGLLAAMICPDATARNELFRFTVPLGNTTEDAQVSYPVLLSQAVEGYLLKTILVQNKKDLLVDIHPYHYAQFFLWTLFTNPEDHKEDNLMLVPLIDETGEVQLNPATGRPWLRFVSFDSDHAFVAPLKQLSRAEQLKSSFGKVEVNVNVKTYVYCHDLMHQPLNQEAIEAFLAVDLNGGLLQCLNELDYYNHRCFDLFTDGGIKDLYTRSDEKYRSFLLSGLGEMGVQKLYGKIFLAKLILSEALAKKKKDPTRTLPTPHQLLTRVIPLLATRYEQAFKSESTPLSRFNHISKHAYVNIYHKPSPRKSRTKKDLPERQSQLSLAQTLSSMQIGADEDYKADEAVILSKKNYVAQNDMKAFEILSNQRRTLHALREKLYDADISHREKLALCKTLANFVPSLKIEFLNGTAHNPGLDFKRIDKQLQEAILKSLYGTEFTKLNLRHCHALTLPILKKLVPLQQTGTNTSLQILDISDCVQLGDDAIQFIATTCLALEKLNISDLPKLEFLCLWETSYFSKGTLVNRTPLYCVFEKLQHLIVVDCSNLKRLWIRTSGLHTLALSRCPELISLRVRPAYYVLDLSGWNDLSDERLKTLIHNCPTILTLNLVGCPLITDREIREKQIRDRQIQLKIFAYGENHVGKTACAHRYIHDEFLDSWHSTLGVDFYLKELIIDNIRYKLSLWETHTLDSICVPYCERDTHIFLFIFDVTCISSYEFMAKVINWIDQYPNLSNKPRLLVGNKIDQTHKRSISYEEGLTLQEKIGALAYLECSAKTGEGVDQIYLTAAKLALQENSPRIKKMLRLFENTSSPRQTTNCTKIETAEVEKDSLPTDLPPLMDDSEIQAMQMNKLIHKIETLLQRIYPLEFRPELHQRDLDYVLSVELLLENAQKSSNDEQAAINLRLLEQQYQTLQNLRAHKLIAQFCILHLLAKAGINIKEQTTKASATRELPDAVDLASLAGRIVSEAFPPTVISGCEVWTEEEKAAGFVFSTEKGILQAYFASRGGFWSSVELLKTKNAETEEQLIPHQLKEMV